MGDLCAPCRPGAYNLDFAAIAESSTAEVPTWTDPNFSGAVRFTITTVLGVTIEGGATDLWATNRTWDSGARAAIGFIRAGTFTKAAVSCGPTFFAFHTDVATATTVCFFAAEIATPLGTAGAARCPLTALESVASAFTIYTEVA